MADIRYRTPDGLKGCSATPVTPSRSDQEIFDETAELARYLLGNVIGTGYEVSADFKFHEATDPRAKAAWGHAVHIMESVTKTEMADVLTSVLERPVRTYGVRLWATVRALCETTVEASSHDEAVRKAAELKHEDFAFVHEGSIEGDETAMVYGPPDDDLESEDSWAGEPGEVDMRAPGEPFSWDAVNLVKELAAFTDPSELTRARFQSFVARAKAACSVVPANPANAED